MARGWESKEVESQIEDAAAHRKHRGPLPEPPPKSAEQLARDREVESLEMARLRVVHDLDAASHPRHKAMLEDALRHLNSRIAALNAQ